jgi:hypothetical protein
MASETLNSPVYSSQLLYLQIKGVWLVYWQRECLEWHLFRITLLNTLLFVPPLEINRSITYHRLCVHSVTLENYFFTSR